MFTRNGELPNVRCTRQSNLFHNPKSHSDFAYKLPLFALPTLWNKWEKYFDDDVSRSCVKQLIKKCTLELEEYLGHVTCTYTRRIDCNSFRILCLTD